MMQLDLSTLYYLTVGTLVVATAMTLWERQPQARRARELGIWAAGYAAFALGCLVAMNRSLFPGTTGWAAANLVFVTGYLLILHGVACLDGRPRIRWHIAGLGALALLWAAAGTRYPNAFWNHVAAVPIALACGLTAWTLLRSRTARGLRSRPVAVAIFAGHALFYVGRAVLVPLFASAYGEGIVPAVARITMLEAVLYSVAMPMVLLALVREEAHSQLAAVAGTDHLTGLGNRHAFFARGTQLLAEGGPHRPVSLLAFDLDHFKAINDRHGHAGGDTVLRLFAQIAQETVGPGAVLVRLGGEEFAALLPGLGVQAARQVGERVARGFAEVSSREGGPARGATVSVGLAEARPGAGDLGALLGEADRALYRAKALGRNRVETIEPGSVAAAA